MRIAQKKVFVCSDCPHLEVKDSWLTCTHPDSRVGQIRSIYTKQKDWTPMEIPPACPLPEPLQ